MRVPSFGAVAIGFQIFAARRARAVISVYLGPASHQAQDTAQGSGCPLR